MLRRRGLALTLVLTLAATLPVAGCSGGTPPQEGAEERAEEGARTSGEAPAHGDRDALGGTLVATGAGLLLTQDLAGDPGRQGGQGGGWQERMTLPAGYAVASVHAAGQELYVAELDSLSPMSVNVYDLETFGHRRSVVWPGTEDLWRVRGLAVAPDGRHLAARVEG